MRITHKTIQSSMTKTGIGVHRGKPATVRLHAAPVGHGIVFYRTDKPGEVRVCPESIKAANRAAILAANGVEIWTPEHLLAAGNALGITNLKIEIDQDEVPILDGSSHPWVEALSDCIDQQVSCLALSPSAPVMCEHGNAQVLVLPADTPRYTYVLSYPGTPMGTQAASIELTPDGFITQISKARTFGLRDELEPLLAQGLAQGVDLSNVLAVEADGYSSPLRYDNEPARHKLLDMIGDFALLGQPLCAHVIGVRSGHALNVDAVIQLSLQRSQCEPSE